MPFKQVVRPGDEFGEGPVPFRTTRLGVVEEVEPLVEPFGERGRAHGARPGGGELDGERQPVDPADDLGDRRRVVGIEREGRVRRRGTLDEQPDRRHLRQVVDRHRTGRHGERLDPADVLAREARAPPGWWRAP